MCNYQKNSAYEANSANLMPLDHCEFKQEIAKLTDVILTKSPFLNILNSEWTQQVLTFTRNTSPVLLQNVITQTVLLKKYN